jgi:folate-dependent phosphoribosylglycinamide formyltransferase PurN
MKKPLFDFRSDKLRVAGLISGSGKSLLSVIDRQKALETVSNCSFEVVGLFSDNPNSQAKKIATDHHLPVYINDIRAFCNARNTKINDRKTRQEYDQMTVDFLTPLKPDIVLYAGYVWATTQTLLDRFNCVNCHPADLSVEKQGQRLYAGANGVRDALLAGETRLYSSFHQVTSKVDHGPILLISRPVMVEDDTDLDLNSRSIKYLRRLNEKSRKLCALGIEKIANQAFTIDETGSLYYEDEPIPKGFRL